MSESDPGSGVASRDPVEARSWTWIGVVGVATAAYALCMLWPQVRRTEALGERVDALRAEVAAAQAERDALVAESQALEADPSAIERALRRRLRFLRTGEQVFAPPRDG
ncbi:MAG: septum formation initiator family protein [Planctomycetota bacterium]